MARIRTIKPSFFRHEDLYLAEHETGLPLRVAYAGLWCAADREGRFRWKPRELKLDVLPFDEVDFSRVLDALLTRGWIRRYTSPVGPIGYIPTWRDHQVINNRESESALPEPIAQTDQLDASATRAPTRASRVTDLHKGKGKGKGKKIPSQGKTLSEDTQEAGPLGDDRPFDVIEGGKS